MALPVSGPLSLSQIQGEFGGSNPISLSEYYRGGGLVTPNNTNVPTSGAISISNFYGATKQFAFTIGSNQTNADLRTLAINAGWDQSAPVVATIGSGVYISSSSTGVSALTVGGSFPSGVTLTNNGFIVGMGGAGGTGAGWVEGGVEGSAGSGGGLALSVSVAVSVTNNGVIAGGGGGGGGGQSGRTGSFIARTGRGAGGGGGGRSSLAANSAGGPGGPASGGFSPSPGGGGGVGTVSGPGAGGAGTGVDAFFSGSGGSGGDWGAAGASGGASTTVTVGPGPYSGGSGGFAVSGNGNITWLAFGTRLGGIA